MSAMQWREWPASDIPTLGKKNSTGLTIGRGIEQQILHFIQRNARVGEDDRPRGRNLIPCGDRVRDRFSRPASLTTGWS